MVDYMKAPNLQSTLSAGPGVADLCCYLYSVNKRLI